MTTELRTFASPYITDKFEHGVGHGYDDLYEDLFEPLRREPIRLLEIGVLHGESLRLWRDYFVNHAAIVGLDIDRKVVEGTIIYQGDQADPELLDRIGNASGPFDIIIDDGSHIGAKTTASFRGLVPFLTDRGIYVVEDLRAETSERFQDDQPFTKTGQSEILRLAYDMCSTWRRIIVERQLMAFCK